MTDTLDTAVAGPRFLSLENEAEKCTAWAATAPLGDGVLLPFGVPDPQVVSPEAGVNMLIALQRLVNWAQGQQVRYLARLATRPGTLPMHSGDGTPRAVREAEVIKRGFLREEIACALHVAPMVVQDQMDTAVTLVERLPGTVELLDTGDLPYAHARALADAVTPLDDETCTKVEARVLARATTQTRALFRRSLRRAVATLDPRGAAERHQRAVQDRKVTVQPEDHAMAFLGAYLPCDGAQTVTTAIQSVANKLAAADTATGHEHRTADQLRADALVAICAATLHGQVLGDLPTEQGHRPSVQVCVALSTLLHLDDQPGDLAGYGPIPADMARRIAADLTGTWRRLITDDRGQLLDYGRTKYRPPAALRDFVVARDRTERFPGSTRGPRKSEIDHIQARIDGGDTNEANLHLLAKRSQTLKHQAGWIVERLPDSTTHWTTPQGRHHYQLPEPYPIDTTADGAPE